MFTGKNDSKDIKDINDSRDFEEEFTFKIVRYGDVS